MTLNPGSNAAIRKGCRCPVVDNNHGRSAPQPPDRWVMATDCPLHVPPAMLTAVEMVADDFRRRHRMDPEAPFQVVAPLVPDENYEPEPDDLTRGELAELAHLPWSAVADTLDEWLARMHGITSSHHNVGAFLDLLAERGYRVTPIEPLPPIETLLGAPE